MRTCCPILAIAIVGILAIASCTKPTHTCRCTINQQGSITTTSAEYKKSKSKVEQMCADEKKFHEEQYLAYPGTTVECKVD